MTFQRLLLISALLRAIQAWTPTPYALGSKGQDAIAMRRQGVSPPALAALLSWLVGLASNMLKWMGRCCDGSEIISNTRLTPRAAQASALRAHPQDPILHSSTSSFSSLSTNVSSIRSLVDGSTAIPFLPTVVPLAVRSPYLGTYLADGPDKDLSEMSPRFWTGAPIGWTGLVRVDGQVFNWMGNLTHWPAANNTSFQQTASTSKFTFAIGESTLTQHPLIYLHATFLSPITPSDLFRQSLPFSYLMITVESADGLQHQVEVYTDINGLWCADDEQLTVEWSTYQKQNKTNATSLYWQAMELKLQNQRLFQEQSDRILYGSIWYNSMSFDPDVILQTHSAGEDGIFLREAFSKTGSLDHPLNTTFRPIRTRDKTSSSSILDEPVLAYAHAFGIVSPRRKFYSRSVLITIGHVRTPLLQYMTAKEKIVELEPLWSARFANVTDMIGFHLLDYHHALAASEAWDFQLDSTAKEVHSKAYAEILTMSTQQIFMALEASKADYSGTEDFKSTDSLLTDGISTMVMLKEISSNGNCQTVDVITPMLPFLIYTAPHMIPKLLEPVLRYIATGLYRPVPTPHDLGDHYPNATGRNDFIFSNLPLEESGDFLNLVLACLRLRTCEDQARAYYKILVQWADWLVENALYPDDQRSTDDFFGTSTNQTSLAVKGILGLRSMAEISGALGQANDSARYGYLATQYANKFLKLGVSDDHTHVLGSYGNQSSWSTQYNLLFDKLYGFQLFPDWLYEMQDQWYLTQAGGAFGPPLDSRSPNRAKTDWMMWAAAASTANQTRNMFVKATSDYVRNTKNFVFGDLISVDEGWSVGFLNRPVVGGHFSLLALDTMGRYPNLTSHQSIFDTMSVEAFFDNLERHEKKLFGYGRTPTGKMFIIGLGAFCVLFLGYRAFSRRLAARRLKSAEIYQSVVIDDDDISSQLEYSSTRGRSQSLLGGLKQHTHDFLTKQAGGKFVELPIKLDNRHEENLAIGLLSNYAVNGSTTFNSRRFELPEESDSEKASEADWDLGLAQTEASGLNSHHPPKSP
ncbi:hypothetical protein O181_025451 [Austropuccinia psidii MF-1]|uniref:Glutaminase A n=1 Tax=Austropuccinia psidii MF-1 TaxID=1389203 RepID=A0A9Q3CNF9_9BASI|nr:hypothetical protein [Austropuccinia psidii MF-1]